MRVHYAALLVSLLRAGLWEAASELRSWAEDNLDVDPDELDEDLDLEDYDA